MYRYIYLQKVVDFLMVNVDKYMPYTGPMGVTINFQASKQ